MHSDTHELKQKWGWAKQARQRFQYTLMQREELHSTIENLEQTLRSELQTEQTDEIKRQLAELKQKRRDLDHLLDESEELTEESIAIVEQELIDKILLLFPNEREGWEHRQGILKVAKQAEKGWAVLLEGCERLQETLERACALRRSVQGMGMFNYIFGISPNAAISRALQEGERTIKAVMPLVDISYQREQDVNKQDFFRQLIVFLKETEKQVGRSWGFRHLDTHICNSQTNLKAYLKQIEAFKDAATNEIGRLEKENMDWIERLA